MNHNNTSYDVGAGWDGEGGDERQEGMYESKSSYESFRHPSQEVGGGVGGGNGMVPPHYPLSRRALSPAHAQGPGLGSTDGGSFGGGSIQGTSVTSGGSRGASAMLGLDARGRGRQGYSPQRAAYQAGSPIDTNRHT